MDCHLAATLKILRRTILVIGYGNVLRCDDGVGQHIANTVKTWEMPNVEAIAVHQLTPELAEQLATVDMAIFIDAYPAIPAQDVRICAIELAETSITTSHQCEPQTLLAMTHLLYSKNPQAWWVTVPGVNFELGDTLSTVAEQGIESALQQIKQLITTARPELCMKLG